MTEYDKYLAFELKDVDVKIKFKEKLLDENI